MSATSLYDPEQRAIAARLADQYRPRWVIWWGVGSRRYWAVPAFEGAAIPIVDAPTPNDLTAAIHQLETAGPPARTSVGTWSGS
jgi:hypothetical protein